VLQSSQPAPDLPKYVRFYGSASTTIEFYQYFQLIRPNMVHVLLPILQCCASLPDQPQANKLKQPSIIGSVYLFAADSYHVRSGWNAE